MTLHYCFTNFWQMVIYVNFRLFLNYFGTDPIWKQKLLKLLDCYVVFYSFFKIKIVVYCHRVWSLSYVWVYFLRLDSIVLYFNWCQIFENITIAENLITKTFYWCFREVQTIVLSNIVTMSLQKKVCQEIVYWVLWDWNYKFNSYRNVLWKYSRTWKLC